MFAVSTLCQPIRQMYWLSYRSGSLLSWSNTGWRWWRRGKDMQPKQLAWNQSWTAWRNCYTPTRLPTRGRIRYGLHYLFSNQKHQILLKKKGFQKWNQKHLVSFFWVTSSCNSSAGDCEPKSGVGQTEGKVGKDEGPRPMENQAHWGQRRGCLYLFFKITIHVWNNY